MAFDHRTTATAFAMFGALVLAGCGGGSSAVRNLGGATATTLASNPVTDPTVITAPADPTGAPDVVSVAPADPGTSGETVPPIITSPATEPPTTPAPAVTDPPPTIPETTVPETTLPPEPPTTLDEPAPPAAELIRAIGREAGDGTRAVQQRLLDLGFWVSGVDGDFGLTTKQGVMAFQKYNGLPVTGKVDQATADSLTYAPFKARGQSTEGDIVEINKTLQLLFIVHEGKTLWVLNTSTGNGQPYEEPDRNTPGEVQKGVANTPTGLFKVYREKPEGWWEGDLGKIYRPKYFRGGIAVHGSGNVPNYPASHGCVRVSVPAMDFIWDQNLIPQRTPVWVYGDAPAPPA